MALKSLKRKSRKEVLPDGNVNITSLMDVLTVLLFFLIKSFTVSSSSLDPPKGIELPVAKVHGMVEDAVKVTLGVEQVFANDEMILKMNRGTFRKRDVGSDDRTLVPLQIYLEKELAKRNAVYEEAAQGEMKFMPPGKILIEADKNTPFGMIKYVFHTAAVAGYSDYQFVVRHEE